MALNTNHIVEDLNEIKCAIVEKGVSSERAAFLKKILEYNKYQVVVAAAAPPKAGKSPVPAEGAEETSAPTQASPELFTVGVTDVKFNAINALFGRALKTANGHIVTPAYWHQTNPVSHDEVPYYEQKA